MIRLMLSVAVVVVLALLGAPTASAGTYTVNACSVGERLYANGLLKVTKTNPPSVFDTSCSKSNEDIDVTQNRSTSVKDDSVAILGFTAPTGTSIASFAVNRRLLVRNSDTPGHNPYVIGVLGGTVFEGAGNYSATTKKALGAKKAWYGGASNAGDSGWATVTPANRGALAGYDGTATQLTFRVGCSKAGSVCDLDANGLAAYQIRGLSITLNDATAPVLGVVANGLLGGGSPGGATPVTLSATDAAGISSAALIDVTDPARPQVVGGEVYDPAVPGAVATDKQQACTYAAAQACPGLTDETIVPTALSAGVRQLLVRVTDTAGNVTDAGPYRIDVATPSNRGALNGVGATETGKLSAAFTTGRKGSRTVNAGQRPTIQGRLVNDAGAPIANARLTVYTRDTDASRYVRRGTVTTGAEGRYAMRAKSVNSRYIRVVWTSHEFDTRAAAAAAVKLRVRARASIGAPRRVSVGQRFAIRGRLKGARPPRGVKVFAEAYEAGAWRVFARTRATGKGSFKLTTRLRSSSSRGSTFRIRARIIARAGWPYTDGVTRAVKVAVR